MSVYLKSLTSTGIFETTSSFTTEHNLSGPVRSDKAIRRQNRTKTGCQNRQEPTTLTVTIISLAMGLLEPVSVRTGYTDCSGNIQISLTLYSWSELK